MKTIKTWLATIAVLLCSVTASAHDFEVNGIFYNITSSTDLTVAVTYKGDRPGSYMEYSGMVIIPSSIIHNNYTYSVTSVDYNAFNDCMFLTSITIPASITRIECYSFGGCISLKEVIFEDGDETLELGYQSTSNSLGRGLFYDCPLENIYLGRDLSYDTDKSEGYSPFNKKDMLTTLNIGENVTTIGTYAFLNCSKLSAVTIPESVMSIGFSAFENTPWDANLTDSVVYAGKVLYRYRGKLLPNGIFEMREDTKGIAGGVFMNCKELTSITLPESVMSIGDYAFYGCNNLASIAMSNSVTCIGENAFSGCSSLTSIIIPGCVTNVGYFAFDGCI